MNNDAGLERDLKILSGKRIFFGHQSVGENILEGIGDLERAGKGTSLRMVELGKEKVPAGPFLAESRIGKNGSPETKCAAFTDRVRELAADSLDIAVMKFCFVDFNGDTDVKSLFARYRETIDSLRAAAPGVTFVHVTAPLTVRTPGWKKLMKKVIGRAETSEIDNVRRNEFNDLLRDGFGGEPLFDLAGVESTYPAGSREEFTYGGRPIYTLIAGLSDDGVHLNKEGRDIAAREFLRVLALAASETNGR